MKKVALLFILFANSAFCQTANRIPSKYHGTWNVNLSHCKSDTSDGITKITANTIEGWESYGEVTSIRQSGADLIVELSVSEEGTTGTDKRTLSRKGDKLIYNGFPLVKCNVGETKVNASAIYQPGDYDIDSNGKPCTREMYNGDQDENRPGYGIPCDN